jgi:hypothetical protein
LNCLKPGGETETVEGQGDCVGKAGTSIHILVCLRSSAGKARRLPLLQNKERIYGKEQTRHRTRYWRGSSERESRRGGAMTCRAELQHSSKVGKRARPQGSRAQEWQLCTTATLHHKRYRRVGCQHAEWRLACRGVSPSSTAPAASGEMT